MTSNAETAFDLIIRGFARLERGVHPVAEGAIGAVRYLRWPERGRRGQEFSEEFFALDLDPVEMLAAVRTAAPGPDHLIADVRTSADSPTDAYLSAGYEFGSQEPLMLAELGDANATAAQDVAVARVESMDAVTRILAAQESVGYPKRLFSTALLADPKVSIRAIFDGDAFAAIGKAALIDNGAYVTDVMTMPADRKQGYGEAIMRQLHADARAAGLTSAALTSTAMAKPLYERLGYRQVGTVTIYATPDRA
jgi:GNAT superfamily N-acetyltransferase